MITRPDYTDVLVVNGVHPKTIPVEAYGLELEFSYVKESFEGQQDWEGKGSCWKLDGSIYGAELVTVPMTLEDLKDWLSKRESILAQNEIDSRCGMHVHINRKRFQGDKGKKALRMFVYILNHIENKRMEEKCGRQPNFYCEQEKFSSWSNIPLYMRDKYKAVNRCNSETVEVRSFSGTNNVKEVIKRLNWLEEMIEWCFLCANISALDFKDVVGLGDANLHLSRAKYRLDSLGEKIENIKSLKSKARRNLMRLLLTDNAKDVKTIRKNLFCSEQFAIKIVEALS